MNTTYVLEQLQIQRINDWRTITWYCTTYLVVDEASMTTESQLRGIWHNQQSELFTQTTTSVQHEVGD